MRPDPALGYEGSFWGDDPPAEPPRVARTVADAVREMPARQRRIYAKHAAAKLRRSTRHAAQPHRAPRHEARPSARSRARRTGGTSRGEPASPSDDDPGRGLGLKDHEARALIDADLVGHGGEIDEATLYEAWDDFEADVRHARTILGILAGFVSGEFAARWDTARRDFLLTTRRTAR